MLRPCLQLEAVLYHGPSKSFNIYVNYLSTPSRTKLLSAEVKNSQVILQMVLPILTKFVQKSQIRRLLLKEVAKQSAEYSGLHNSPPFADFST